MVIGSLRRVQKKNDKCDGLEGFPWAHTFFFFKHNDLEICTTYNVLFCKVLKLTKNAIFP